MEAYSALTHNEFAVISALQRLPGSNQRTIAEHTKLSLGTVNSALRDAIQHGFVVNGEVTSKGLTALEPHRVHNAVIMAAGLSSRFSPISYELPKGLLTVRGEVLIERQIRQLQAAGIKDISVVVGYKQERFFYLEDKFTKGDFCVKIVPNKEYRERNNNSSIMAVAHLLSCLLYTSPSPRD